MILRLMNNSVQTYCRYSASTTAYFSNFYAILSVWYVKLVLRVNIVHILGNFAKF